jgi:hypothetical protein
VARQLLDLSAAVLADDAFRQQLHGGVAESPETSDLAV